MLEVLLFSQEINLQSELLPGPHHQNNILLKFRRRPSGTMKTVRLDHFSFQYFTWLLTDLVACRNICLVWPHSFSPLRFFSVCAGLRVR